MASTYLLKKKSIKKWRMDIQLGLKLLFQLSLVMDSLPLWLCQMLRPLESHGVYSNPIVYQPSNPSLSKTDSFSMTCSFGTNAGFSPGTTFLNVSWAIYLIIYSSMFHQGLMWSQLVRDLAKTQALSFSSFWKYQNTTSSLDFCHPHTIFQTTNEQPYSQVSKYFQKPGWNATGLVVGTQFKVISYRLGKEGENLSTMQ